jgi:hypothetical protein
MSKKQRRRLRQIAQAADTAQQARHQRAEGRGPELRALFVKLLNQFEGELQRDATASERDAVLDEAIDQLPDVPPQKPIKTKP